MAEDHSDKRKKTKSLKFDDHVRLVLRLKDNFIAIIKIRASSREFYE